MQRAAVIGGGSWGTAFCGVLANNVALVTLWCHSNATAKSINESHRSDHYLLDYELPDNIIASSNLEDVLVGAELVVLAVPSTHLSEVTQNVKPYIAPDTPVLVLTKGIQASTGLLMSEVVASILGNPNRICALSGPNHAEEVSKGAYSAAVCAGPNLEIVEHIRTYICTPTFRVYTSSDYRGVEICGATKNVIAIACGIVAGSGLGDNTLAVIMTRGIAEIGRMVAVIGGDPITCMGLAGMGDLVATCTSVHSRNRRFGEAFVKGTSVEEFETQTHMVVEGAHSCKAILDLASSHNVEVPIVEAVYNLLYKSASFDTVASALVSRTPTEEFYGIKTSDERNSRG